eukprot:scaffold18.g2051.t1
MADAAPSRPMGLRMRQAAQRGVATTLWMAVALLLVAHFASPPDRTDSMVSTTWLSMGTPEPNHSADTGVRRHADASHKRMIQEWVPLHVARSWQEPGTAATEADARQWRGHVQDGYQKRRARDILEKTYGVIGNKPLGVAAYQPPPSPPADSPPPSPEDDKDFVVNGKLLTAGLDISCVQWAKDAKAAYEASILAVANVSGDVVSIQSFCREINTSARRRLQATAVTSLEITYLLKVHGTVATAQSVATSTNTAASNGTIAKLVQQQMGSTAFKPVAPPAPPCIVGVNCRSSPPPPRPPPPPTKIAQVYGDPRVIDFTGKRFNFQGKQGGTMPILSAGNGAAAVDLTAKLAVWAPRPKASTIMTSVTFRSARNTVLITQSRPAPTGRVPNPAYTLTATVTAADGTTTVLRAGTKKTSIQLPGLSVFAVHPARIVARAPTMAISVTEGKAGAYTGWLNTVVSVFGALSSPVGGVLRPSYIKSLQRAKALSVQSSIVASIGSAPV